jgi:glyoxylase-like metal-dependent hydrolase (beta-lactamase superfamily II)
MQVCSNLKCRSHAHWDHCRPIRNIFPSAKASFGPGTMAACSPGHLEDANSQWDGRFFDPKRATENVAEFTGPWRQFGSFDKAMDYFGDGSFWIVQAPGHMPGNCLAVARLRSGDWICLGSDCCHSRSVFGELKRILLIEPENCWMEQVRLQSSVFLPSEE